MSRLSDMDLARLNTVGRIGELAVAEILASRKDAALAEIKDMDSSALGSRLMLMNGEKIARIAALEAETAKLREELLTVLGRLRAETCQEALDKIALIYKERDEARHKLELAEKELELAEKVINAARDDALRCPCCAGGMEDYMCICTREMKITKAIAAYDAAKPQEEI